jgi:hypothetical protein
MRHGPHHGAQKSTTTGSEESRTSVWNCASVISRTEPLNAISSSEGMIATVVIIPHGVFLSSRPRWHADRRSSIVLPERSDAT